MGFTGLIKKAAALDNAACNELLKRYYSLIYNITRKRISGTENIEDITQDVFLRIIKSGSLKKFANKSEEDFKAHIVRICLNRIYDQYRQDSRHHDKLMQFDVQDQNHINLLKDSKTPYEILSHAELQKQLNDNIESLKENYREVVKLRLAGLTNIEIAEYLGKPPGTIDSLISRALHQLRDKLRELHSTINDLELQNGRY